MAAPAVRFYTSPEQSITVKVLFDDKNRRFKLPLKDLEAQVFPQKVSLHLSSDRTSKPSIPISYHDSHLSHCAFWQLRLSLVSVDEFRL